MKDEHLHIIEAYFKQSLSDDELKDFESDLKKNPELERSFREYKLAIDVIDQQAESELRDKFIVWKKERKYSKSIALRYIALAASVLLLFGLFWLYLKPTKTTTSVQLASANYSLPSKPEVVRGDAGEHWTKGVSAYERKHFKKAINEWESIEEPGAEVNYYMAHCYFNIKDYPKSIQLFTNLSESNSAYSYLADWYLLLNYLAADNESDYNNQLAKIIADKNHPYYQDALEIKQKLE